VTLRSVPLSRRFVVAPGAGRAARHVRALAGTSDWRRGVLDRAGAGAILLLGTRWLPAAPGWSWPSLDEVELAAALHDALPDIRIDAAAIPRQADRTRLSLLCRVDDRPVVVKLGAADDGIENEARVLSLLTDHPLPAIATPQVLATGRLGDDMTFLATDALGLGRQRPAIGETLSSFERDLADRLASLPRPSDADNQLVPVHGDLAPWNLRRTTRGLALFDWEAAGWGPPGSDLDHYRRACASLR
jgi:hypothetical protein